MENWLVDKTIGDRHVQPAPLRTALSWCEATISVSPISRARCWCFLNPHLHEALRRLLRPHHPKFSIWAAWYPTEGCLFTIHLPIKKPTRTKERGLEAQRTEVWQDSPYVFERAAEPMFDRGRTAGGNSDGFPLVGATRHKVRTR